ncbi:hypothetical protein ACRRTK_003487 [Alexandromys fortis]
MSSRLPHASVDFPQDRSPGPAFPGPMHCNMNLHIFRTYNVHVSWLAYFLFFCQLDMR